MRHLFWKSLVTWMWITAAGAGALPIVLRDTGGAAPGTAAGNAFAQAALQVGSLFRDPVTVFIDIGFSSTLGAGVLGSTSSFLDGVYDIDDVRTLLGFNATSANDALALANQGTGPMEMWQNDVNANYFFDNDGGFNNYAIAVTRANARGMGLLSNTDTGSDASIRFSSLVSWDFDPSDGIAAGSYDFVGVAMHEILHTMGFSSGVNDIDYYTGNGPEPGAYDLQGDYWYRPLDLFRYGFNGQRDLTTGPNTYFSIDGGATNLGFFSTGEFNGDGNQPGHWRDLLGLGLMDPTLSPGERGMLSARDLVAMDVIGWELEVPELDGGMASMPLTIAAISLLIGLGRRRRD